MIKKTISIKYYTPSHWVPLWQLRFAHLAEHGIILDPADIPLRPAASDSDAPEWDFDQIDQVYLSGGGGFWLAWHDDEAVGSVGAQGLGGVVELRRMYVRATHRRVGIGRLLVQALIDHCRTTGIEAVELWTAEDGPGRRLYERLGFQVVSKPGSGYEKLEQATRRSPNVDEIRMRLEL